VSEGKKVFIHLTEQPFLLMGTQAAHEDEIYRGGGGSNVKAFREEPGAGFSAKMGL